MGEDGRIYLQKKEKKFEDLAAEDKIRHEREKKEYENKIKDENQRNQEAYLSHLEIIQQHYQEYAKMQTQWLSMMGYGGTQLSQTQQPGMQPETDLSSQIHGGIYDYAQAASAMPQQFEFDPSKFDPNKFDPSNPQLPQFDPATSSQFSMQPELTSDASIISDPPKLSSSEFQQYFSSDECSDMYDQLGYTPEEMACLQNAWFAAAQQAQLSAMNEKQEFDVKDMLNDSDGVEDQSDHKDLD